MGHRRREDRYDTNTQPLLGALRDSKVRHNGTMSTPDMKQRTDRPRLKIHHDVICSGV
ncbi:hypothetical protein HMPREF9622_00068, partial [Cutibacterium modestum HL037PA3]